MVKNVRRQNPGILFWFCSTFPGQQVQLFKSNNLKKNQSYHNQIISIFKLKYFTLPYSSHCPFCIRINTQPGKPCNRTVWRKDSIDTWRSVSGLMVFYKLFVEIFVQTTQFVLLVNASNTSKYQDLSLNMDWHSVYFLPRLSSLVMSVEHFSIKWHNTRTFDVWEYAASDQPRTSSFFFSGGLRLDYHTGFQLQNNFVARGD